MRISKDPEVRKQEMIDTAMKVFANKGYEAATMADIAKEMNVVSGLCYRYFRSKQDLYETALMMYARESSAPFIQIDGKEKYRDFFHQSQNKMFHRQLELAMIDLILPHMIRLLHSLKSQENIRIDNPELTAQFILHGQMPILNDDTLPVSVKAEYIRAIIKKIIL